MKESESAKTQTAEQAMALHVDGTLLKDAAGNDIILKGISTHGISWFPQYIDEEAFRQFHEEWGANVIRLAMYTGESGGYCTGGNKDELLSLIDRGVTYATNAGMYVIIDWHILSDNNPMTYEAEAKEFFETISEKYADYDNVIYEICNEPNGDTDWKTIKNYAEEIIPIIRENTDAVILVGTPNWCQYVNEAAEDPITDYDNIMYTLHFYAATHKDDLRNTMVKAIQSGLPIFVSEYGICDASGSGALDLAEAEKWMEVLDQYHVSRCMWNLSNKDESSSILQAGCGKTNHFEDEDLSEAGKWLVTNLGDTK